MKKSLLTPHLPLISFLLAIYAADLLFCFCCQVSICAFSLLRQTAPSYLHSRALASLIRFAFLQISLQQSSVNGSIGCLLIGTIGSSAHIVPAFLIGRALVSCFVCAFFSCALELFICRICHGKQACMITTFAVSLLVMYASGCLIPSAFLPDMLRRISATLPGSQLKNMIFWQFGQSVSSFDIIILIIEGILLIIAALLAGTFKKGKLTHSLRERSKYEEK